MTRIFFSAPVGDVMAVARVSTLPGWRSVILTFLLIATFPAEGKLKLTHERGAVVARVTPGARTVWFGVVHERVGYRPKITDMASIIVDQDGDGEIRLPQTDGVSNSVWMVVDLASGDYAIEGAKGAELRRAVLAAGAVRSRNGAAPARVVNAGSSAVVWLVRPGVGAWIAEVDDGGPEDADNWTDGNVAATLSQFRAVGDSPAPPDDFERDDVLAIIEPFELRVTDLRVTK